MLSNFHFCSRSRASRTIQKLPKPGICSNCTWRKITARIGTNGRQNSSNGSKTTPIDVEMSHNNIPNPYLDLPAQIRTMRPELDAALARVLDSCAFCLGPEVLQFEEDFAQYCGAK